MADEVAARAVEYRPATQRDVHTSGRPRADEKDPAAQETQMEEDVAAMAVE
jgi:hypothetical protein